MKSFKSILTFLCALFTIALMSNNIFSQTNVCKLTFCNCCGDSLYYHLYTMEGDTLIGTFWTRADKNGCTLDSIGNVVAGRHYYIDLMTYESHCGEDIANIRIYFTGCICRTGWQEVKLPCCPLLGDNLLNNNSENLKKDVGQPNQLVLYQNYPNPFNPVTTIKFSVSTESSVRLIVYDINGREVTTLLNEMVSPGYHEINWDATNYASGVYFYKLAVGEYSTERKMTVIK